ncbi:MAG: hypothetical protein AAGE80_19520 [Pseudomonadota bacterium]
MSLQNDLIPARNTLPADAVTGRIWGSDPHDSTITWEREGLRTRLLYDIQFVDLTRPNRPARQIVTSSLASVLECAPELLCLTHNSEPWSIADRIGGTVARLSTDGEPLSRAWIDRVTSNLQARFSRPVIRAWAETMRRQVTFQPGYLHKVTTAWSLNLTSAEVTWGGETGRIDVLIGADPESMKVATIEREHLFTAHECLALYRHRRGLG